MGALEDWQSVLVAVTLVLVLLVFLKVDALSVLMSADAAATSSSSTAAPAAAAAATTSGFSNNASALWAPGRNTEFSGTNQGFRARRHHKQGFESPAFWTAPVNERDMDRIAEMHKQADMYSGFAAGRSVNEAKLASSLAGR